MLGSAATKRPATNGPGDRARWTELRRDELRDREPRVARRPKGWSHGLARAARRAAPVRRRPGGLGAATRPATPPGFAEQFARALDKVLAVVRAAGGQPADVARLTVYVTDLAAYRASARSRSARCGARGSGTYYPAMALVEVKGLVDRGALVEIEATAVIGGSARCADRAPSRSSTRSTPRPASPRITLEPPRAPERADVRGLRRAARHLPRRSTPSPACARRDHRRGARLLLGRRRRGHHRRPASGATPPGLLEFTTHDLRPDRCTSARCRRPVIAALNGTVAGAGAVIAAACDLRIAAESAQDRVPVREGRALGRRHGRVVAPAAASSGSGARPSS